MQDNDISHISGIRLVRKESMEDSAESSVQLTDQKYPSGGQATQRSKYDARLMGMRAHNRMDLKSSVLMQRLGAKGYKPYRERVEEIPTVVKEGESSQMGGRSSTTTDF